ncbi:hypothetical protein VHEMI08587 [[Torrubiella] hemipterigena]|uniref:Transmembrane protein n=1 Tax=[Torrubiella] hemipterigena TaxID=1531966 RepID=A0A0A1TNG1_9HYPO|nr:hypothetical protein VHEMI08587 [[Torrubiella] hemipterigena]
MRRSSTLARQLLVLLFLSIAALCIAAPTSPENDHDLIIKVPEQAAAPAPPSASYPHVVMGSTDRKKGSSDSPAADPDQDADGTPGSLVVTTKTPVMQAAPTMTKIPVGKPIVSSASSALFTEPGFMALSFALAMVTLGMGLI